MLESRYSTLKKEGRSIIEKQYFLLNMDVEGIALKVRDLSDDTSLSNMAFTDSPNDHNVIQSSFLHKTI